MIKPFLYSKQGKLDGRHKCILEAAKYSSEGTNITYSNPKLSFILNKKDYYPSNSPESYAQLREGEKPLISENCELIFNKMNVKYGGNLGQGHSFTYKTDGLIFLPDKLGVFQTHENDFETLRNPFKHNKTWANNYKWKPSDHLTIDFKVEFIKDIGTNRLAYKYFDSNKKYLKVNLISAVKQYKNSNNKLNFYLVNSGVKIQSIPEEFPFFATNPFIGSYDEDGVLENNMGEAYFEVNISDNILCENGDFITNGVICECSYERGRGGGGSGGGSGGGGGRGGNDGSDMFRWKPQRVRADKATPNAYNTAATTWGLINDPITKEHLCSPIASKDNIDTNLESNTYYNSNQNTEFYTTPINKFSNNFVKSYLIERGLTGYVKPKVLDLSIGKLGDMYNYAKAGVHTLIGLDISEDNINNPENGAATRLINLANTNAAIGKLSEKTMLIVGTAVKNFANGECVRDNINKYYIDVLYGRAKGNTPKLKKMEGVGLDKFDMVSCMYSIHYMMNNEAELDNFLRNVSENLLDQGYFIGTCLNGDAILSEMGSKSELKGVVDGKTVFLIKKQSDNPDDYKKITVGNKIIVYYEKFAGEFPENLVNIQYLREKAKGHSLKLIDYKSYLEEPGNLLSMYEASGMTNARSNVKAIRNSTALTTWAKFNCYFMFQKVRKIE